MAGIPPTLSLYSLFCWPHVAVIKQNTPDTGVVAEVCWLSGLVAQHAAVGVRPHTKVCGMQFPREMVISATLGRGACDLIGHLYRSQQKLLHTKTLKSGPKGFAGIQLSSKKHPWPINFGGRLYTLRLHECGGMTVVT